MRITYDKSTNAVYIDFVQDRSKIESVETDGEWPFNVDTDEKGNVLGIEIMDANTVFNEEFLNKALRIG